jgi:gluconate 5-dehydrogenase
MKWKSDFDLMDSVILITGSSGALGQKISEVFINSNAIVYGFDIVKTNSFRSKNFHQIECDLTNYDTFKNHCEQIYKNENKINVLINNAGVAIPCENNKLYSKEDWDRTIKINLTTPFFCSQIVKDFLKKEKSSSIINITSISAKLGFPNNPAYGASKGGLMALSKSLASEYAEYGIRVNCVGPGYVGQGMTEKSFVDKNIKIERESMMMLKKWNTAGEVGNACLFLASDASKYITGQDLYVDGGWTVKGFPDL